MEKFYSVVDENKLASNYTYLIIWMENSSCDIEYYNEEKYLLNKRRIPSKEAKDIVINLVEDYLEKNWIYSVDIEDISCGGIRVFSTNDIALDLFVTKDLYFLLTKIQKIYFAERKESFSKYKEQIQTYLLECKNNNEVSKTKLICFENKINAQYSFLSNGNRLVEEEKKHLNSILDSFFSCNTERLFLVENFCWGRYALASNVREKVVSYPRYGCGLIKREIFSYFLRKGNLEIEFQPFLLPYVMERVKIYESNTEQKLVHVLSGGKY